MTPPCHVHTKLMANTQCSPLALRYAGWCANYFNGCTDIKTPNFLEAQFKIVIHGMRGEPILPTDEGFGDDDVYP